MDEVLVIGGGGFLGQYLVRMLRENGNPVRILSRSGAKGRKEEPGITYYAGATHERDAVFKAVEGVQIVFDLAANPAGTWEDMQRTYIAGARHIGEACLQFGVRRLIYASTTATLDWSRLEPTDESAGTDPQAHLRPGFYHISKIAIEKLLLEMHRSSGLPVVILRPALIVGRGGTLNHDGIGTWREDTRCIIVGKGDYPLALVLVQDVAAAFFAAMDAPDVEGRTFNLAGDVRPTAREMVKYMAQRSKRDFRAIPQSMYKLHAVAWVKYLAKLAVGKEADRPSFHTLECDTTRAPLDCSAAKKYLNWKPVSDLETFLKEAVDPHLREVHPQDLRITG